MVEALGRGGMGVVYRAHDKQLSRDVAIKLVVTSDDPHDTHAARLLREAQALAQLSHPNVVAVYDAGRAEGGVFVAMELVSGAAGDVWLREKRPWREVLRVFRDAGRGLAAAHAVGLVHRDFKPGNLIVGDDGRVRVLDFGLARTAVFSLSGSHPALRITDDLETAPIDRVEQSPSLSLLDVPLTQAGAIVGTPQYMAPEQHTGTACDARADQFSFCLAFYKGLYGERPFAGKTYAELKANVLAGKLEPPHERNDVPSWLHDVIVRGLAVDPAKRWPSMDALLAALGRDPDARRKKLMLAGGALVLVAGVGAVAWIARPDPAAACRADNSQIAAVWSSPQKTELRAAFMKSGMPFADATYTTVASTLDTYTDHWRTMRTDACMATRVHGTQSAQLLDLRMECLQRRLNDTRAVVDVLLTADRDVVSRAAEVVARLPALDECADADSLRAPVRPPTDPATRTRVETAQRALATADALWNAARYADAAQKLAPVLADAQSIGWRPLQGEALLLQARLDDSTGDYTNAEKHYKDAAFAAEAGRDDRTAALARNGLVWITGERLGHYAEAEDLARDAAAKVERLGRNELIQADLDQKVAALLLEQGKYKEAEEHSRNVLKLRQQTLAPNDPTIASALADLGDVAVQTMRFDEAIGLYRRALVIAEQSVGAEHPLCGTLRTNLSAALSQAGKHDEALAELEHARTIMEHALGPDHAEVGTIEIHFGNTLLERNRPADAALHFRKAAEIWTRALGADHPNVATAIFRGGQASLAEGDVAAATTAFNQAIKIWQAKLGADHPSLAVAYSGLADAALAQHKPAVARDQYTHALTILEKALGPSSPELVELLTDIANCDLALHKPKLAVPLLERAVKIGEAGGDATELEHARSALADARKQR